MPTPRPAADFPQPASFVCVGASARWMAQSFSRSGIPVAAVDLFNDWDLQMATDPTRIGAAARTFSLTREPIPAEPERLRSENEGRWLRKTTWPRSKRVESLSVVTPSFLEQQFGALPVIWGGGWETLPSELRGRFPKSRLLNCPSDAVDQVTHPDGLLQVLTEHSIRIPNHSWTAPADLKNWIVKGVRRSGGHRVNFAADLSGRPTGDIFFQRLVPGRPMSAAFWGAGSQTELLGMCQQILGLRELGARFPFQFCGAWGPLAIPQQIEEQLQTIGSRLVGTCGLQGLFGIDFIWNDLNEVWLIEVNPRPTASMELLERCGRNHLMLKHVQGWESALAAEIRPNGTNDGTNGVSNDQNRQLAIPRGFAANQGQRLTSSLTGLKLILYNRLDQPLPIDAESFDELCQLCAEEKAADIPNRHSMILPGHPIVSLFWDGPSDGADLPSFFASIRTKQLWPLWNRLEARDHRGN